MRHSIIIVAIVALAGNSAIADDRPSFARRPSKDEIETLAQQRADAKVAAERAATQTPEYLAVIAAIRAAAEARAKARGDQ